MTIAEPGPVLIDSKILCEVAMLRRQPHRRDLRAQQIGAQCISQGMPDVKEEHVETV